MKVEELTQYGKTLLGLPKETEKKLKSIVLREIRNKFGLLGFFPFFISVLLEQRRLKIKYTEAYQEVLKISEAAAKDIPIFVSVFNIIARKEGRENAYEFVKGIIQKVADHSLSAMYQFDDLVKCEGDAYENFSKFTSAWFKAMDKEGTWKVKDLKEEKNELSFVVYECINCTLGEAFDCPEISKLGCDHDLAGYPVILDRVNAEFRRPHTIAWCRMK